MNSARFSFDIAEVIFDDTASISPARDEMETRVVRRFKDWLDKADRAEMHAKCSFIDMWLVPALSNRAALEVARLVEARFPEVIENMPLLSRMRDHLQRGHQLAQVFQGPNLAALVAALRDEGDR